MNNGKMIGAIEIDLSKAFDIIGHGLLISKLSTYGVSGRELDWFRDSLWQISSCSDLENVVEVGTNFLLCTTGINPWIPSFHCLL